MILIDLKPNNTHSHDAYTKLSCSVAISGLSANLLTSFRGERADLQSKHGLSYRLKSKLNQV